MNWQIVLLSVVIASGYSGGYLWGAGKKPHAAVSVIICATALFGFFVTSK